MPRTTFAVLVTLALVACQTAPATPIAHGGPPMSEADAHVRIQGEAIYFEKILMPEGSQLRVQVLDARRADTPAALLTERLMTVGEGPYEFAIDVPRAQLRDGGRLGLHVSVSMPDGSLRFVTRTRVPITISTDSLSTHLGQVHLHHVQP